MKKKTARKILKRLYEIYIIYGLTVSDFDRIAADYKINFEEVKNEVQQAQGATK